MRHARWILLLLMVALSAVVAYVYAVRQPAHAPILAKTLPRDTNATASDWVWSHANDQCTMVEVRAKDFKQIAEPNRFELQRVDLKLYHKDCKKFDHVTSASAVFDIAAGRLFSDGEVVIKMGLSDEETEGGRLVEIKSSGVAFESQTGKASTDRAATFTFAKGNGSSVGVSYDPAERDLHMWGQVKLEWHGTNPKTKPMLVEGGELHYKERESKVYLTPWSKLTRATMTLDAKDSVATLDKGALRLVETTEGRGVDEAPARRVEYSADQLVMNLSADGVVEKIVGNRNARLVATTKDAQTNATADRVEMEFVDGDSESELRRVLTTGKSVIESKPVPRANAQTPETRILRSEQVELKMRPGGREIETIDTLAPGALEFLPNRAGQRPRRVDAERIHVAYGPDNAIQSFRATQASTRTENQPKPGQKTAPPSLTWSKEMAAEFAPKTGEMTRMEQWGDFRYEEGVRKARAERGALDNARNQIQLTGGARVSDASGSTSAERILLDQKSDDFTAEGNVASTRLPDKKGSGSTMLSSEEPTQARAQRMRSQNKNTKVLYETNAVVWQGANRLEADRIEIDREESTLHAKGNVVSQLVDKAKEEGKPAVKKASAPVFTIVRAPELTYSDEERLAHYKGGVILKRAGMDVKAREIRAYLKDDDDDSSLDHAFADGAVEILQLAKGRTRRGTGEHAEYFVEDEKIILEGGEPQLVDSLRGTTKGKQLTYFANDDRLLVNGQPNQPAVSDIIRKHRPNAHPPNL